MFSVIGRIHQVHSHSKETKCPVFHLLSILRREIQNKAVEERKEGKQRPHGMVMAPLSLLIRKKPIPWLKGVKCPWWQATLSFGKCQLWGGNKGPGSKIVHGFSGIRRYTHVVATSLCKQGFHLTMVTGIYKRTSQHEPCRPSGPGNQVSYHQALDL